MSNAVHSPLLEISALRASFRDRHGSRPVLHGINLFINKNETLALVGESGSGKSLTALSIPKLFAKEILQYDEGRIMFNSRTLGQLNLLHSSEQNLRSIRGAEISVIFQEPMTSLNPVYTCGDQITEVLTCHLHLSQTSAKKRTLELFEMVRLPDPTQIFSKYPHQLSGGQKQRVMIAMGISCNPSLLICDEPTTALDATVQKSILELIRELQKSIGLGVLFITHDLGIVSNFADRVAVMKNGQIIETGTTQELLRHPQNPYTKSLLECRPALFTKGQRLPSVEESVDHNLSTFQTLIQPYAWQTTEKNSLVVAKDISISYSTNKSSWAKKQGQFQALQKISFSIFEGETLGLVGESGSGKSTLGKALAGLLPFNEGCLSFRGNDQLWTNPHQKRKLPRLIQFVFQDPFSSLNPKLKIGQALMEPMIVHGLLPTKKAMREKMESVLSKVGLRPAHLDRYPHEFSGGQRQRIVIARALVMEPQLLICDESVSALDVSVQAQVLNLLNDLKTQFGLTLLFISHDLSVIRYMSDRILVLNKGKMEELGPTEQVCTNPSSDYTKQLLAAMPVI